MPAINVTGFLGEQPRVIPRLLAETASQRAINTRLDDGGLTPIHRTLEVDNATDAADQTIYLHGDTWLSWAGDIDAAPAPIAEDRLYYTGDGVPKMLDGENIYPLALPSPIGALTAVLGGGGGAGDVVTRIYVFTYVTEFGEESAPCVVSNQLDWQPGNTVTLSGFPSIPAGRNITKQRIYRSQTGQAGTYFYLIDERAASTSNYSDTVAVDAFQEALQTADWTPPPDTLSGLTSMSNGMMAGFSGKDLYFCEPYYPHAWPEKYALTTDYDIVSISAIGSTLIVLTTGQPYIAVGSVPDSVQIDKLNTNAACINKRAVVNTGFAVCFPSNNGLWAIYPNGTLKLVTAPLYNRDKWQALSPSTLVAGQHNGRYIAFYDVIVGDVRTAGSLTIDLGDSPFLSRTANVAQAVHYDQNQGALYYLVPGTTNIVRYDDPNASLETQYWKSKPFTLPYPENFGAIRIEADVTLTPEEVIAAQALIDAITAANTLLLAAGSIEGDLNAGPMGGVAFNGDILAPIPSSGVVFEIGVYADGKRVKTVMSSNVDLRLPAGFKARVWELDVLSNVTVTRLTMARTMDELGQVA